MPANITHIADGPLVRIHDWMFNQGYDGINNATQGRFYPQEHRAVGDGVTDDSGALANTDAANAGTGVTYCPPAPGYRLAANTTLAHALTLPPGAQLKPDSGITLTLNGTLDAGPYQIFGGAGTVALGPGAARRIHPEWVGAKADNSTDNATPFAAWKALVPARGGRGELQQGVYKTSGTLLTPSRVRLDGAPGTGYIFAGDNDYLSGSCLYWIGATGGTVLSYKDASLSRVSGIQINGAGISGVVGALIDSDNAPSSKNNTLEDFTIYACGVYQTNGYGVRIGTSAVANTQADTWRVANGYIVNCDTGLSIYDSNASFQGVLERFSISGHRRGVEIVGASNFAIRDGSFGGQNAATIADIVLKTDGAGHGGTGAQPLITNCQTERVFPFNAPFLLVDASCSPDGTYPVTLISNVMQGGGIQVNQTKNLILIGNVFTDSNCVLNAPACIVESYRNTFSSNTGIRTVADLVTTSGSPTVTSATASFVTTDVGKRLVRSGCGPADHAAPGIPLGAQILSVTNGTTAVMDTNATATASGVAVQFDWGFVRKGAGCQIVADSTGTAAPFHASSSNGEGVIHRFEADGAGQNPAIQIKNNAPGGGTWDWIASGTGGLNPGGFVLRNEVASVNPMYADSGAPEAVLRLGTFGAVLAKGQAGAHRTLTASTSAGANDDAIYLDTTSGAVNLTLPGVAGTVADKRYTLKWIAGANAATVLRNGTDTIDGATSYAIPAVGGAITVQSDNSVSPAVWRIVGKV